MSIDLTKADIKALREANDVLFNWKRDEAGDIGKVVCIKRIEDREDARQTVPAQFSTSNFRHDHGIVKSIDWVLLSAGYGDVWRTAMHNLRVGDSLAVKVLVANNTPLLDEAGLVHDELFLKVRRPLKGAGRFQEFTYQLDSRVTTPYSLGGRSVIVEPPKGVQRLARWPS